MKKRVVIVGGGASGLMCALNLYIRGIKATILEVDNKLGKKLLKTGNGRCNLTNGELTPNCYNQDIDRFLRKFDTNRTLQLFNYWGLETYKDSENRYYPRSNLSSSVLDMFLDRLEFCETEILTNTKVESISKVNGSYELQTNNGVIITKNVVLAIGGEAGEKFLKDLKIKHKPLKPSLCALKVKENLQELNGIRQSNVRVSIEFGDYFNFDSGEILFKENGVSGICIFNLSALMARKGATKANLSINLMPDKSEKDLMNLCVNRKNVFYGMKVEKFFNGMFHKNLGREILKRANIKPNINVEKLSFRDIENIVDNIRSFKLSVCGFYDNEQVHTGGILLSELKDNLEVRNNTGLFACGEIIDVDGLCGGYNLQWAWTSGTIVGENVDLK